jgi:hypothetical protein
MLLFPEEIVESTQPTFFLECARAIQALANEAMNSNALTGNTYRLLNKVVSLSQASKAEPGVEFEGTVYNQFAGPHHLASLLGILSKVFKPR